MSIYDSRKQKISRLARRMGNKINELADNVSENAERESRNQKINKRNVFDDFFG